MMVNYETSLLSNTLFGAPTSVVPKVEKKSFKWWKGSNL